MTKTVSQKIVGMNGDEAVAFAAKQAQVDVVAAYPITPQTIIVERFSDYVANGEVDTQFVCVESEHSALSVCGIQPSWVSRLHRDVKPGLGADARGALPCLRPAHSDRDGSG